MYQLTNLIRYVIDPRHVKKKKNIVVTVFDTMSGIFTPMLPSIVGAGFLKWVMAVLASLKLISLLVFEKP